MPIKPKLVLANNQRQEFTDFHASLQQDEKIYDYAGYRSLLFEFDTDEAAPLLRFINVDAATSSADYSGVYLNGYLSTVELATTTAIVLDALDVPYVNRELGNAPCLSKLSAYAKLARAGVSIPHTFGGAAYALLAGIRSGTIALQLPLILKRADADRGLYNYKFDSYEDIIAKLEQQPERSLWVLQDFIPNDGFYLVSVYHDTPEFAIFRAMGERPDGRKDKAHMFKPKGGENAELIALDDVPTPIVEASMGSVAALNRQIASVDSLYDPKTQKPYVLEVNYNPQLVTISTFKEVRQQAFINAVKQISK